MDYSNRNQSDRNNDFYNDRNQFRGDNDDNYGQNFGRGNFDSRGQHDQFNQGRHWSNENMNDRSGYNRGNDSNWGGNQGNWRRQGYNDWGQGYGNDRFSGYSGQGSDMGNYGRSSDRNFGSGYNTGRGQDYGGNRNQEERGFWDKTKDEVSSWFGDDDAERRRKMDKMEQGQHRGKGPKGYRRSDERIKEDINDRLSDDHYVDASDIDVQVSNGEVTLTGTVEDRQSRRRAEDLAEFVSGVTYVQNNIRIGKHSGSGPQSSDISFNTPSSFTQSSGKSSSGSSTTGSSISGSSGSERSTNERSTSKSSS